MLLLLLRPFFVLAAYHTHRSDRRLQPAPAEVQQALVKERWLARLMLALLRMCAARALRTAGCALHFVSSIVIGKVLLLDGQVVQQDPFADQNLLASEISCAASGCARMGPFYAGTPAACLQFKHFYALLRHAVCA
jgi:hypothetical protein